MLVSNGSLLSTYSLDKSGTKKQSAVEVTQDPSDQESVIISWSQIFRQNQETFYSPVPSSQITYQIYAGKTE